LFLKSGIISNNHKKVLLREMTINDLRNKAKDYPLFKLEDVFKWFPQAKRNTTLNQLRDWSKLGYLQGLKRGIYKLSDFEIEEPFIVANFIYSPSYISLETALNYYSLIPDIPFQTTSITTLKTNSFEIKNYGVFSYSHLKPDLFFGYETIKGDKQYVYNIALPEKALFDYLYLSSKRMKLSESFIEGLRLSIPTNFDWKKIRKWLKFAHLSNEFNLMIERLIQKYA